MGSHKPEPRRLGGPPILPDEYGKAERAGEASFRGFAAKHLNVEIGLALRSDGWAGAAVWERGVEFGLNFATILERMPRLLRSRSTAAALR